MIVAPYDNIASKGSDIAIGDTDMDEAISAIANLKSDLADAITSKGVETSKDDTFKNMVKNISKIEEKAKPITYMVDPETVYTNTRPTDWLPMPTPEDNEIYMLFHIPNGFFSLLSFMVTCTGDYKIEFGTMKDGEFVPDASKEQSVESGEIFQTKLYSEDFGNLTSDQFAQCMIKISGTDILTFEPQKHDDIATTSRHRCWNVVEIVCRLPSGSQFVCGSSGGLVTAFTKLRYFRWFGPNELRSTETMFDYCESLTAVRELDTSKSTNCKSMFQNCYQLQAVPNLDTSKATDFTSMFYNCYSIPTIPTLEMSLATSINSMFYGCTGLRCVPPMNTVKATSMSNIFNNALSLMIVESIDITKMTTTSNIFPLCYNLQKARLVSSEEEPISAGNIDLKDCITMSHKALVEFLNNLPAVRTTRNLTLPYSNTSPTSGLAQLTDEEIAIATNKGWNVIKSN